MRILSIVVVAAVAGIGLAGCAGSSSQLSRKVGVTSGPLPTPQAFVVDSRPPQGQRYLAIGAIPPKRSDPVLSIDERKKLEASLLATPGRKPSPEELKAKGGKKPVVAARKQKMGFFPPQ